MRIKNNSDCVYLRVIAQCKKPTAQTAHLIFVPTQKPMLKKPKELYLANARPKDRKK